MQCLQSIANEVVMVIPFKLQLIHVQCKRPYLMTASRAQPREAGLPLT